MKQVSIPSFIYFYSAVCRFRQQFIIKFCLFPRTCRTDKFRCITETFCFFLGTAINIKATEKKKKFVWKELLTKRFWQFITIVIIVRRSIVSEEQLMGWSCLSVHLSAWSSCHCWNPLSGNNGTSFQIRENTTQDHCWKTSLHSNGLGWQCKNGLTCNNDLRCY